MAKIKNITTDDLGYKGQTFEAGQAAEVPEKQAKAMSESMPDRFRLVKKANGTIRGVREAPKLVCRRSHER